MSHQLLSAKSEAGCHCILIISDRAPRLWVSLNFSDMLTSSFFW